MEFKKFNSIPRLSKEMVITEKIDGTNACIVIEEDGTIYAQSRNKIITPQDDNYGFAKWVEENKEELKSLGVGYHYGEWWGKGIQRGYELDGKTFSLFYYTGNGIIPEIVSQVPVLYTGLFSTETIDNIMWNLKVSGSKARNGFMNPEGIVIYHRASKQVYKKTFENDNGKWSA